MRKLLKGVAVLAVLVALVACYAARADYVEGFYHGFRGEYWLSWCEDESKLIGPRARLGWEDGVALFTRQVEAINTP